MRLNTLLFRFQNRLASHRRRSSVAALHDTLEPRVLLAASLGFDYTTVASDLHPTERFYGDTDPENAPFTIIRYGFGEVTSLEGLPATAALTGVPGNLTFKFGSSDVNNPVEVLTLSTFDDGLTDGTANEIYTPDGVDDDPAITLYNNGTPIATGSLLRISLEIDTNGISTSTASSPSRFQLTSAVGPDSTIYDELVAATNGTGIVDFTLSAFHYTGPWAGVGDAEIFSSTGTTTNLIDPPETTDDHGNSTENASAWDRSGAVSGQFEAALSDAEDYFAVELEAGRQYSFQADDGNQQSGDLTFIYVLDAAGNLVAEGDWLAGTWATQVTVSTASAGTYYLHAFNSSSSFGSYSITQISDVAVTGDDHGNGTSSSDASPWDRTSPVAGNIEVPEDKDWFVVDLSQGVEYTFRTNPGTLFDTILSVYDSGFSLLDENDDANNGENGELYSQLTFSPPSTATYYLVVEGYGSNQPLLEEPFRVGSYHLEQVGQNHLIPARPVLTGANPATTTDLRPTISWDPALNAAEYDVFISSTLTPQTPVLRVRTSATSLTPDIDLGIGRYRVWVQGISGANVRGPWSLAQGLRINTAASISNAAQQYYATTAMPTFTWDQLAGAVSYEIWVNNQTSGATQVIHTTTTTHSFTPTSDLEVGVYRYWVRGISNDGFYGGWSSLAQIYVGPVAVSPIFPTFEVSPTFEWTSVGGVSSYDFWLQHNASVIANPTELSGTTWSPASDLTPGTYHWWVRPNLTAGGKGPWSHRQTFNTAGIPQIDAPLPLVNQTNVSWTPVSGAVSYDYYYRAHINGEILTSQFSTAGTKALVNTSEVGVYTVWVRAKNGSGVISAWSPAASLTVPNLRPVIDTPIQVSSSTTISWATVNGVAEYEFRVRRQFEGGTFEDQWRTPKNFVVIPTTLPGLYRVWVRSITAEGFVSQFSPHGTFTVAAVSDAVETDEFLVSLSPSFLTRSLPVQQDSRELPMTQPAEPTGNGGDADREGFVLDRHASATSETDQTDPEENLEQCFAEGMDQLLQMLMS